MEELNNSLYSVFDEVDAIFKGGRSQGLAMAIDAELGDSRQYRNDGNLGILFFDELAFDSAGLVATVRGVKHAKNAFDFGTLVRPVVKDYVCVPTIRYSAKKQLLCNSNSPLYEIGQVDGSSGSFTMTSVHPSLCEDYFSKLQNALESYGAKHCGD